MTHNLGRSLRDGSRRAWIVFLGFGAFCATLLHVAGAWDLVMPDRRAGDRPSAPVAIRAGSVEAALSELSTGCPGLTLDPVLVVRSDTAPGEGRHPFAGVHLDVDLVARLDGASRAIAVAGNGMGPGAEAEARREVLAAAARRLAPLAPSCFPEG